MKSVLLLTTLCFLAALPAPTRAADPEPTQQWATAEISLTGPADGNPFADTSLSATFLHDKQSLEIPGFYDGDGSYKIRFMPPTIGDWSYTTHSNRPELADKTGHLACIPPTPDNHGPVKVANTFHFAYADGSPYFPVGTTCYNWVFQSEEVEAQTLATLKIAPFNKIRMFVTPSNDPLAAHDSKRYPYVGTAPKNWDFSRFDPTFFQHLDQRVCDLCDLHIQADIILINVYEKGKLGFNNITPAQEDQYLRYVIARLSAYRNVWWSIANEFDLMKTRTDADWDHYFQIVAAADPYNHLRSIHHSGRLYNYSQPWVTHASLQNGSAVEDFGRAELYRDVYNKPIVFDEVKYEGNFPQRWGQLSAEEMVARFWQGTIAGVYVGHGEVFKDPHVVWTSAGGTLKGQSPPRIAFLKSIMDAAPPTGIDPIDKWQDVHTAGKPGEYYLIYFGTEKPAQWTFELPAKSLKPGTRFHADILDTWNMTITPIEQTFTTLADGKYRVHAENLPSIPLPQKPYLAIRLTAIHQ